MQRPGLPVASNVARLSADRASTRRRACHQTPRAENTPAMRQTHRPASRSIRFHRRSPPRRRSCEGLRQPRAGVAMPPQFRRGASSNRWQVLASHGLPRQHDRSRSRTLSSVHLRFVPLCQYGKNGCRRNARTFVHPGQARFFLGVRLEISLIFPCVSGRTREFDLSRRRAH